MKQKYSPAIAVLVTLSVLSLSMLTVRAAGGRIEGKVTDQKGAAPGRPEVAGGAKARRSYRFEDVLVTSVQNTKGSR